MKVLIAYGSKMGGTAGLAEMLRTNLMKSGMEVDALPASDVASVTPYDSVVIGGALYAGRWHKDVRKFVKSHKAELKERTVWLFSSGPLDDSALSGKIPPVRHVQAAMDLVGAKGHMTFGGRLPADAKGFPASAMAKTGAGDWRDEAHVQAWARTIARGSNVSASEPPGEG